MKWQQLADEIEASEGLVTMSPRGATQLGIKKTAAVIAMLRDRRKYSLLESQFANCHKEIQNLRNALVSTRRAWVVVNRHRT